MNTENSEEWRPVISYGGRYPGYEASSLGRVRRTADGFLLKPTLAGRDRHYLYVTLFDGKLHRPRPLAILVAEAFMGLRPPKMQVNHINGVRTDNRVENYEYVTHHQNHIHAGRLGLKAWGERHGLAKLTADQVRTIREHQFGGSVRHFMAKFGVSKSTIESIRRGKTWRHLDEGLPVINQVARTETTQSGQRGC